MMIYHGSPHQFDRFDFSKMRTNGTQYGVGFYMTDRKDFAKSYATSPQCPQGFLYEIEFKGKKPLELNENTLSPDQLKELIIRLHEADGFLWNINDLSTLPYEVVLNQACEYMQDSNDVDTIAGIINTCGDAELVLNTLYELFGYDCIIVPLEDQTFYIATVNEAIEFLSCEPVVREA